jgi:hypothetical protein
VSTWTGEDETEDDGPVCLNCLVRPPRPGSVYCSRLCRFLGRLRRFGVLAELVLAELPRPVGL